MKKFLLHVLLIAWFAGANFFIAQDHQVRYALMGNCITIDSDFANADLDCSQFQVLNVEFLAVMDSWSVPDGLIAKGSNRCSLRQKPANRHSRKL